ncbi:MAG: hypothetical protein K6E51_06530 [Treponema sp.]|nr:hypothetical protein [Treponema sp.]
MKKTKKMLYALFDYYSFTPNKKLEAIINETLSSAYNPFNTIPLDDDTLDLLSAAGNTEQKDIPPEMRKK